VHRKKNLLKSRFSIFQFSSIGKGKEDFFFGVEVT
jgi:hypothetical protein